MDNNTSYHVIDFLVVDDQGTMLRVIRGMLKNSYPDKVSETALNGEEALNILKTQQVKFVITDWNMPKLDGIELVKIIRKNSLLFDIPILMVSDELSKDKFLYAVEERVDGYQLKPFSEAKLISAIDSIINARKKQTPLQRNINRLHHLILIKKFDKAIDFAKDLLAQENSVDVSILLSECYFMKGEYRQSEHILKEFISEKPIGKACHLLGRICAVQEKFEEALEYFTKAIEINPLKLDQKIDAARAYLSLGNLAGAENIFSTLIQTNPTHMTLIEIGKTYLDRGDINRASIYLEKAFDGMSFFVGTFIDFGAKLLEIKDFDKAVLIFKKCLKFSPDNTELLFLLAKTYVESNNVLLAKPILERILILHPNHSEAKKLLDGQLTVIIDKSSHPSF